MRPSPPALASKSSKQWLARQSRDTYVRQRTSNPAQYRSRSAFKLLEMDAKFNFLVDRRPQSHLNRPRVVVDLGAAPGGWSQVVALNLGYDESVAPAEPLSFGLTPAARIERQGSWSDPVAKDPLLQLHGFSASNNDGRTKIIGLDLLRIQPIRGVTTVQADFLSPLATPLLRAHIPQGPSVDVLLSDMAANTSGNSVVDAESSLRICHAVWRFAEEYLMPRRGRDPGGVLVLKHFVHPDTHEFRTTLLNPSFRRVIYVKPPSSRAESAEGYWVCIDKLGPNVKRPPLLPIDHQVQLLE